MNLTIHRGTEEIGGSCIELQTAKARILIDFGLPLKDVQDEIKKKSKEQLIESKLLPDIKGLYKGEKQEFNAVLISHAHQDHYGLLSFINPAIQVYMSKGTKIMVGVSYFFNQSNYKLQNVETKPAWKQFRIKDIMITPYLVDHSGFDAFAFLIEAEGKRIFYTGDFRGHGRKKIAFETMIKGQIKNVDYLIMEGTMLSREDEQYKTEEDVQKEMESVLKQSGKLTLLECSSQNIDRIVSAYKACLNTKTLLVIDPYTAYVLYKLKPISKHIPQYDWRGIKVFCVGPYSDKIFKDDDIRKKFGMAKIEKKDVFGLKQKMLIKNSSLMGRVLKGQKLLNARSVIYSQWDGYLKNRKQFWDENQVKIIQIHTSGHAYAEDLVKLANAIKPKHLIPIHTEKAKKYVKYFKFPIKPLQDGKKYAI